MSKANNAVGPQTRGKKPGKSKVVPALGLASFVAGSAAATQFFAWKFEYQAILGANYNHLYAPWAIFDWWHKWNGIYPDALTAAGGVGTLVAAGGVDRHRSRKGNRLKLIQS